ncbi:uncharacterized protein YecE (DUF72 family) [Rhizomicrobium palustre]|uniref:Uncharacterized protein YecE (DUF72 family) n=1 Tax=Rhizomicrobium palustre TaxID=189966 RepID=A0A846MV14_9PROT|nr:DUF72 domain-containing protein [Rhizomicrobium palustre]NIK87193.1 uncharacterized protein YecE (DUF72 family) [Rhizomicrobium palustre]
MKNPRIRIGISGWRYKPWRGVFYPKGLRQKDELSFAASVFKSLEINGTFYALQRPENFAAWYAATPEDFVFSVKAPRYITHILRLKEAEQAVANFLASGVLALEEKLGPILWQVPPSYRFDPEHLETFFAGLPHSTKEAAKLARRRDAKMEGRSLTKIQEDRPLRHALEIRHESFRDPAFIKLLKTYDIALVVADTVEWPLLLDETSDFVYCRLHGSEQLYVSGYTEEALDLWATRVKAWTEAGIAEGPRVGKPGAKKKREVFVYFDNDAKVRAPFDAQSLVAKTSTTAR